MPDNTNKPRAALAICLLLSLVTLVTYWPVFQCEFVNLDDPHYVTKNPHIQAGLTWNSLHWAFTARHSCNWHPLTWISHMLDFNLFGLNPAGHHATNLLFHIANSILLFLLLLRMTDAKWRSAFVAALFALHPLHVESVAWVSERKDVLSTFFWVLTLWAYVHYAKRPGSIRYLLVFLLFAMGLMSKPMLVTVPFLLLLVDFWPLRRVPAKLRIFWREISIVEPSVQVICPPTPVARLILEKVPLLALSFISSVITLWAQSPTVSSLDYIPLWYRVCNAVLSYVRYMWKTVWPAKLVVVHPLLQVLSIWHIVIAVLAVGGISILAIQNARKRPYVLTGWFWFLGMLVPVIGLVQVGVQSLADRYTYVPLIGLFIIVAWGGYDLATRFRLRPTVLWSISVLAIAACVSVTRLQLPSWKNSVALFEHALRLTHKNFLVEFNLGVTFLDQGQYEAARQHFANTMSIRPDIAVPRCYLGRALAQLGRTEEAIPLLQDALRYDPKLVEAHFWLAEVLIDQGKLSEAEDHLTIVVQLSDNPSQKFEAHERLGVVLSRQERMIEALNHFNEAIRIDPTSAVVHVHLASALDQWGQTREAIAQYREALKLDPNIPEALNNLAWILASHPDPEFRNGDEAVRLAQKACQLTGYRPAIIVGTLGAAYAEVGRFDEAVETALKAEALAAKAGRKELAEKNHELAELFRSRRPFRAPPQPTPAQKDP